MTRERIITSDSLSVEEDSLNWSLRPEKLTEYVGQKVLVEKLGIALEAAKKRGEPLDHVLLYGPPGLGKTTLSHIIANEMGGNIIVSSGPILEKTGDLMGILSNLKQGDIFFIDEIHRLSKVVEEFLYSAMEDYSIDFIVDKGAFAKTVKIPLKRFTLVGATTRAGLLSAPLRERFGIFHHLEFYPDEDLDLIVKRSSKILDVPLKEDASIEIARRSRGTPRIANRLLKRVRDYATVKGDGTITIEMAKKALEMEGIDDKGLDEIDRQVLQVIIEFYNGGPVGIETLAATLNEESDTIADMVEPFLLKIGFLSRTRSGRQVNERAYNHLQIEKKSSLDNI